MNTDQLRVGERVYCAKSCSHCNNNSYHLFKLNDIQYYTSPTGESSAHLEYRCTVCGWNYASGVPLARLSEFFSSYDNTIKITI
jgi:hypothetical protein